MRHLDLSYNGKLQAESGQPDNGRLPHGGHKGSKRHPPSHLSYDKGREFHQRLEEELSRVMEFEEWAKHGGSPSWSIAVHNGPSYTDESPLFVNNLMAANKFEQVNGINLYNRQSLLPGKHPKLPKSGALSYYRPNRMHQYLSATELKNSASEDVNMKYGRPTRTTLLRARQRSNSAPTNQLEKKRDFSQRLDDIKTAPAASNPNTEYLQLQSVRDGESLHSYLTGARYNRAHCLDSKSVENSGVYMPRHNPALGCFFTGPKGQEYLQEYAETPRQDMPTPPSPPTPKRRPLTAPSYGRRHVHPNVQPLTLRRDQQGSSKYKYLKLNIVGSRLPLVGTREPQLLRLPKLAENNLSDRRLEEAVDQTYLVNQPHPSPRVIGDLSPYSRHVKVEGSGGVREGEGHREEVADVGGMRVEGRSTWRRQIEREDVGGEEEKTVSVPIVEAAEENGRDTKREEIQEEEKQTEDVEEKEEDAVDDEVSTNQNREIVEETEEVTLVEPEVVQEVTQERSPEVKAEEQEVTEETVQDEAGTDEAVVDEAEASQAEDSEMVAEETHENEVEEEEEVEEVEEEQKVVEDLVGEKTKEDTEIEEAPSGQRAITEETEIPQEKTEVPDFRQDEGEEEEVKEEDDTNKEEPAAKEVRFFITEDGVGNVLQAEDNEAREEEEQEEEYAEDKVKTIEKDLVL